jgi:RNA polymerase sigma-70 factor (ECF subfamily)
VNDALASLPERQREAVQFLVLEEQSLSEAVVATRRSKGALKVNLHRALKALRGKFGGES